MLFFLVLSLISQAAQGSAGRRDYGCDEDSSIRSCVPFRTVARDY